VFVLRPSPTRYLHIGSARTSIFHWLYARRNDRPRNVRMDDTGLDRRTEESLDRAIRPLRFA
jgi:glutamyl/glutaminyl-tRNA synthetase